MDEQYPEGYWGEDGLWSYFDFSENGVRQVREWIRKQRFIPCDLSDMFIQRFLDAADQDVRRATANIHNYFYLRQQPGPIFRDRDPSSPQNECLFKNLFMVPLRNLFDEGEVILLTGALKPKTTYSLMAHFKLLTLTIDYLLWDRNHVFSRLKILMDGSNLKCPVMLENPCRELEQTAKDFQKSIPITIEGLYILWPPNHIQEFVRVFDGLRINALESAEEVALKFPSTILPFEFGGTLGDLKGMLDTWNLQKSRRCKFFVHFERRMMNDYRRRICHEKEVREGGKNWIFRMKLAEDVSEYKRRYYNRMMMQKPLIHPAYGRLRLINRPREPMIIEDPLKKLRDEVKSAESEPSYSQQPPETPEKVAQTVCRPVQIVCYSACWK